VRKYLYLAAAAASAAVVALPAVSADAAVTHVLTISKIGGTAVKPGAVLKSGLAKGTSAVFSLSTTKLTCKSAAFSAKVKTNPAKPGKATESLTASTISKCTVNQSGVIVKSLKINNLPYKVSVSDAKGFPVTVSGSSKSKPVSFTVTIVAGTLTVVCGYSAKSIAGHASNTGNTIAFVNQKFTKSAGGGLCLPSANFSAKFGPVRDTSVKNSPSVFVN
jgi:hypothetical protein